MRGRNLPSLNAMRTFEAVARLNSFTLAATELNVTQSATSRMVRSLEEYLDVALFVRQSRRIELTDQGRFYNALIREALDRLEAGTIEMMSTRDGKGTLTIGMLPTFGTRWLVPRLAAFQEEYPDSALNIVSSDGDLDFTKERIDVAIRFGYGNWPDTIADPLMGEEVLVVCSPKLAQAQPLNSFDDLKHHRLIQHSTRPHSWEHWLVAVGATRDDLHWGLQFEHFFMIIEAALHGLGVALLPRFLIEDEIRDGSLVAPFPDRVAGPGAYYIVTTVAKSELPRVKLFRKWLLSQTDPATRASIDRWREPGAMSRHIG